MDISSKGNEHDMNQDASSTGLKPKKLRAKTRENYPTDSTGLEPKTDREHT